MVYLEASTIEVGDVWEFYQDRTDKWKWTCIAATGEIIGSSRRGYRNRLDCVNNAKKFGFLGN